MPATSNRRRPIRVNTFALADARAAAELSLTQLSAKSGVAKAQLSDIETGVKGTTPATLAKIARALGVTADSLLT